MPQSGQFLHCRAGRTWLRSLRRQHSTVSTAFKLNDHWITVFRRSEIIIIKRKPSAVIFCGNKPIEGRVGSQGYRHPALQKPGLATAMQGRRLVATTLVCKSDPSVAKRSGEIDGSDPRLKILSILV